MSEKFTSAGIKLSTIFHINAASNDQPKKPVAIEMPIPSGLNKCGEIRIFKSDQGDDFTNVTEYMPFEVSEHHMLLRVDRFSKYWIAGPLKAAIDVAPLVNFFYPVYDVCFCVYIKQESIIRVGCCESHKEEEMNSNMMMYCNYATVDVIKGNLRNGDASILAMHGRYRISEAESSLQLIFKAKEITYTQPLYLEASQPSEELTSNMKNEVEISIGMKGMREPVLITFMIAHGIEMHAHLQASTTQNRKKLTRKDKSREFGATEQPLLSELKEDFNLVQHLEHELESTKTNNIKDLLRVFGLPYEDRCKVLKCVSQSHAFFDSLSKSNPDLKLVDLKIIIEEKSLHLQPNKAIFMKVKEDIATGKVPFSLETTLKDLSDHPKNWCYILETVACNLNPEEGSRVKSWENVASKVRYSSSIIAAIQRINIEESPFRKLLSILCGSDPSLSVSFFVGKLREIKREDVAKIVDGWLADIVVSTVSKHS